MVRHPVTAERLKELIAEEDRRWLEKAARRTRKFRKLGRYEEASSIWHVVKPVYMKLQHNKCAYCERQLAGPSFGKIEHDIEHFRPKNAVDAWPTPEVAEERHLDYDFSTGADYPRGYHLLAYNIWNYVTACKTCNSRLKRNHFPIAGERNPDDLPSEYPFLVYPLGDRDTDPEELISFLGPLPVAVPAPTSGHPYRRAVVTIDFFELDQREELIRERAERIRGTWLALCLLANDATEDSKRVASRAVDQLRSLSSPHCNCVRAFLRLYGQDQARAKQFAEAAMDYLDSQS